MACDCLSVIEQTKLKEGISVVKFKDGICSELLISDVQSIDSDGYDLTHSAVMDGIIRLKISLLQKVLLKMRIGPS